VPRPARVLAVSGALVAAGVLVVGGTAYAVAQPQALDETYVGCVDLATGAMRLIDPLAGHACATTAGPGQERQISWSRTAGERGPAAPRGALGEDVPVPPTTAAPTTPVRPTKPARPTEPVEPTWPPAPTPDPIAEPTADRPGELDGEAGPVG